jgi:Transposase DDE domain
MEIQLIRLYVLVCHVYDTRSETCFQRLSNNSKPVFTDQELATIYLFAHLQGVFEKKAMHKLIDNYWRHFFPRLPAYQTFVARLNLLEQTFQTVGGYLNELLAEDRRPEIDHLIDSLPVMLAKGGHAFAATVARDAADVGYCASKKIYFHGVRLHTIAQRRSGTIPLPKQIWLREGSVHDLRSVREQDVYVPNSSLIGDKAYPDPTFQAWLEVQQTTLYAPKKKPKGKELSATEKYYNRLVSRLRQPIESFFNWLIDKTDIQRAGTVRSTEGLMIHCWGKLTFAFYLLVFNP